MIGDKRATKIETFNLITKLKAELKLKLLGKKKKRQQINYYETKIDPSNNQICKIEKRRKRELKARTQTRSVGYKELPKLNASV